MLVLGIDPGDPFALAAFDGSGAVVGKCAVDAEGLGDLRRTAKLANRVYVEMPAKGGMHLNMRAACDLFESIGWIKCAAFYFAECPVVEIATTSWRKNSHGFTRAPPEMKGKKHVGDRKAWFREKDIEFALRFNPDIGRDHDMAAAVCIAHAGWTLSQ